MPRDFRFWGVVHWLFKAGLLVSAPAAAAYYGSVPIAAAAVVALALLLLNIGTAIADRLSQASAAPSDYQSEALIRFGDLLTTLKKGAIEGQADRDMAITACLGIIENFCLSATGANKGDVAVSLILYKGSSQSRMRVAKRNPGNERPTNREVGAERLLGHFACQHGASPRVVHNLAHFGSEFATSPTQSSASYKSILFIPLEYDTESGKSVRGFVSIDHARPYAFYGNRAKVVVVTCEPIVNQLRELVGGS